jgi:RNA polymerase subunit RPABC4/transcription elongation factor Spt4
MTKKKECPSCAMEIPDNENVCPICGYEFPERNNFLSFVVLLMVILIMLYFLI